MAANSDLVVVHGPPSPAVASILRQRLLDIEEYIHVYPSQLYQNHPGFGVRDIANHVSSLLKKHKRVVVEDSCAGGAVRDCLLKVIPNKVSTCKMNVIELDPKHGQQQTLWERSFLLAACPQLHLILSDEQIMNWFDEHGVLVTSQSSTPGPGAKEVVSVDLTAETHYKFEVPCLLVQWECMVDSGGYLEDRMKAVCQQWAQANPCGRIIGLCDGFGVAKGHLSAVQQKSQIVSCTKALTAELPYPVYVIQVMSTLDAGAFTAPPSPGLLAFLQRRHCIDLHHRGTVCVYNDVRHMKMAERAGVRHIKIGKILKNPQVMKTCHSASASPVPQMLKYIQLVTNTAAVSSEPSIPLADHLEAFSDQYVCVDLPRGLREFLFAHDIQHVQQFQTQYVECATPIGEPGSRMEGLQTQGKSQLSVETSVSEDQATLREQISEPGLRQIPKWMLGRGGSVSDLSTQASLEKSSSTSSIEGRGRSRHTIYIMTEKELLETAKDVLIQAGKEDLIETCLLQSAEVQNAHSPRKDIEGEAALDTLAFEPTCKDAEMTEIIDPTVSQDGPGTCKNADLAEDVSPVTLADIAPTALLEVEDGGASPSQKKQRLSHKTEEEESDKAADIQHIILPRTSQQSSTMSLLNMQQKPEKRTAVPKKAPDLSILDEIFS